MRFSLSKPRQRSFVGLDVDSTYLSAVQLDGRRIERAVSADLESGIVEAGEVVDSGRLSGALKDFFKDNALPRNVRLGVSNQQIVVRQMALPRIEGEPERAAAVRFQAAEAIAMPLDEAVLDYQVTGEREGADGAPMMHVVVVAARRAMIGGFVDAVRDAGLRADGIDLDAFALMRTLAVPSVADDAARVHCHLAGVTNLAIAVGDSCQFTRALAAPWNGDPVTGATTLADEIRLSIDYYMAQPEARPTAEVVLSGPGSETEGLSDQLAAATGLSVSVPDPLLAVEKGGLPADEDPHRHTVAVGLALGAAA